MVGHWYSRGVKGMKNAFETPGHWTIRWNLYWRSKNQIPMLKMGQHVHICLRSGPRGMTPPLTASLTVIRPFFVDCQVVHSRKKSEDISKCEGIFIFNWSLVLGEIAIEAEEHKRCIIIFGMRDPSYRAADQNRTDWLCAIWKAASSPSYSTPTSLPCLIATI